MPETIQSDRDRVLMMLEEGKITSEEANQLLEALGASEQIASDMQDVEAQVKETTEQSKRLHEEAKEDHDKAASSAEELRAEQKPPSQETTLSKDLSWLSVEMLAGDLDIRVDSSLSEPVVDKGNVVFGKEDNIYKVNRERVKRGKSLTGNMEDMANNIEDVAKDISSLVANIFHGLNGDLKIRIPPNFAVEIKSKAGDVDVDGAAYLKANLLAGDLDAKNIGGIHLNMAAGDVDIRMKPITGDNYIKLAVGDLDIELEKGSSVRVGASVVMGDIDLKGPPELKGLVQQNKTMMGGDFMVKVGEGKASLEIDLNTGDLDVVVAK